MAKRKKGGAAAADNWRNRIVGTGEADPASLVANPQNWREHPPFQRGALAAVLNRVGWVQQVIVNKTTGRLVDGHLRVQMAAERGDKLIPVNYVELDEAEERLVLATMDQIEPFLPTMDDAAPEEPDGGDGTGEYLEMGGHTVQEPQHAVALGDVFILSDRHALYCGQPESEWPRYFELLTQPPRGKGEPTEGIEGAVPMLLIYPGPLIPFANEADARPLVLVQPNTYICGHILDKWAQVHGEDSVVKRRA